MVVMAGYCWVLCGMQEAAPYLQHPSWPLREFLDGGHAEGEEAWPQETTR